VDRFFSLIILLFQETNSANNLNLLSEHEIIHIKNLSSSPMVFATKVLYSLFSTDEIRGHYICGRMISKNIKNKKPLLDKRVLYIKWLVENNFDSATNKEDLWQHCRRAINKSILNNERRGFRPSYEAAKNKSNCSIVVDKDEDDRTSTSSSEADDDDAMTEEDRQASEPAIYKDLNGETESINIRKFENEYHMSSPECSSQCDMRLLDDLQVDKLRNQTCSPMIFATKILFRIFKLEELHGHNVSGKTFQKQTIKLQLDKRRLLYIKYLVEKHFQSCRPDKDAQLWKACCKAINRTIKNSEQKSAKNYSSHYSSCNPRELKPGVVCDVGSNCHVSSNSIDSLIMHQLEPVIITATPGNMNTADGIHIDVQHIHQYQMAHEEAMHHQHQLLQPTQQLNVQFEDITPLAYHVSSTFYN
jgi:hypothetical protein